MGTSGTERMAVHGCDPRTALTRPRKRQAHFLRSFLPSFPVATRRSPPSASLPRCTLLSAKPRVQLPPAVVRRGDHRAEWENVSSLCMLVAGVAVPAAAPSPPPARRQHQHHAGTPWRPNSDRHRVLRSSWRSRPRHGPSRIHRRASPRPPHSRPTPSRCPQRLSPRQPHSPGGGGNDVAASPPPPRRAFLAPCLPCSLGFSSFFLPAGCVASAIITNADSGWAVKSIPRSCEQ